MTSAKAASDRKFLVFTLQGALYALDLAQAAEVSDPQPLWPIPMAPSCYAGAMSFHGDIVAVLSLCRFLGIEERIAPGKLVLLRPEIASLGLLVDTVERIDAEADVTITPPPNTHLAAALLRTISGDAVLLDLAALVQAAENCMAGSPVR